MLSYKGSKETNTTEMMMTKQREELTKQFKVDGKRIKVRVTRRYSNSRDRLIAYVSCPTPDERGVMDAPEYSIKGDDPANDKLWRKYNREELKILREAFTDETEAFIVEALRYLGGGWVADAIDFSHSQFSRNAGCSCGCSPGWLLRDCNARRISFTGYNAVVFTVFIDIQDATQIEKVDALLQRQIDLVNKSTNEFDDKIKAKEQELEEKRAKEMAEFIGNLNAAHEALINREKELAAELEQLKAL